MQSINKTEIQACPWCGKAFKYKYRGGYRKKFCFKRCKDAYHYALRKWAQLAVDKGLIPVEAFRKFGPKEGHYGY